MNAQQETPFTPESPQPLMREIPPGEAYPVAELGPLREVVEAVADISQAPIAIAAQSALSVASLAVQGFADVETLGGDAPCSLFCLTIAESGERKSTCDRLLMRGLRDHERDRAEAFTEEHAAWTKDFQLWESKAKKLMAEAAGRGKDSAKAAAAEEDLRKMEVAPREPIHPNVTAMDPTFEGLAKLYEKSRPALGLFTDEGGGFIGGHAMNPDNKLKTMAGLSRLWNGEPIDRTRAGDGARTYRGRRLAAHIMVQPIAARPLLSDPQANGQGFLARFLMTEPPSLIGTRLRRGHNPASDLAVSAFAVKLRANLEANLPTSANPQELTPPRLTLSPQARELLWRFHGAVEASQAQGGPMEHVRAFASKAVEQAARVAGVLTLWADLDAPEVTPQAMASGVALADFYLSEAKRLAETGAISAKTEQAEALRRWLLESWQGDFITPRDVVRMGPNRMRETATVRDSLATLERHFWLCRLPEGAEVDGRVRREVYRIVRA